MSPISVRFRYGQRAYTLFDRLRQAKLDRNISIYYSVYTSGHNGGMKVHAKAILERLAASQKGDRTKVSLYLSKRLYDDFRKSCGDISASVVMEELMREFVASAKARK